MKKLKLLIAAGGTGGHLFPAMAVAKELEKQSDGSVEIIFIGTENRIESKKVPEAGYKYYPMSITGFPGLRPTALLYPIKMLESIMTALRAIKNDNIKGLICAGAYISIPPAYAAKLSRLPIFLMESNINPGKANKMLFKSAKKIFTSWENTNSYLNSDTISKVILTGNPVRDLILKISEIKNAKEALSFNPKQKLVLIIGGSLGARSINEIIKDNLNTISKMDANFLWQTGSSFTDKIILPDNIKKTEFIDDMATAYSAADLVISRSGATAVSELCIAGKASILIPMAGASNNEQYLNAKNLSNNNAAILIENNELKDKLMTELSILLGSEEKRNVLSNKIQSFGKTNAASEIAKSILNSFN